MLQPSAQPRVAIVIVSYEVAHLLRDCLTALAATTGASIETWVVDNASADDSVAVVEREFPAVHCIANDTNAGFAVACNQALRQIAARQQGDRDFDHVLLLNPDTRVPPDAIARLCRFLDDHPDAAVVGPKLVRQDGSLDLAARRSFPTPAVSLYRQLGLSSLFPRSHRFGRYNLTYLNPDDTAEVDSVVGAFMLVRWQAITQTGLLDERFWMYGEDIDWALRMKAAGWKVYYCPEVVVLHYKGESSRRHSAKATREFYRAMLLFYRKHYSATTPLPLGALLVAGIYAKGSYALLRDRLRSSQRKRVS